MVRLTFEVFKIIMNNINCSLSFVDYERFKKERVEAQLIDAMTIKQQRQYIRQKNCAEKELFDKNSQQNKGFFNDLLWMLEYNHNGFMQLVVCIIHALLLAGQVVTSFLYTLFPTDQDPITGDFINPVLRYAEHIFICDFVYKFDIKGHYNILIGWTALHYLVLRMRAFVSRFQKAKHNRYKYLDLNIVEFETAPANEIRVPHWEALRLLFSIPLFDHKCPEDTSLSGKSRERNLEFNRKVRGLSKIDKLYYYNQIDFSKCYEGYNVQAFEEYGRVVDKIDRENTMNKVSAKKSSLSEADNSLKRKNVSWFRYLFSINLPKKVSYVPKPESRVDIAPEVLYLYSAYLYACFAVICIVIILGVATTFAFCYYEIWKRFSLFARAFAILRANLTIAVIILNMTEVVLIFFGALLVSARSRKVVKLLKDEIEFYRYHLKKISYLYDEQQCIAKIRSRFPQLVNVSTGFKRRFDNHRFQDYSSEELSENSQLRNRLHDFSYMRKQIDSAKIDNDDDDDSHDKLDKLILDYRKNLNRKEMINFNENISYLLDLVAVIQMEFADHKRFFTTILDINLIFGTIGCSLTASILFSSIDYGSLLVIILGYSSLISMIFSLLLGALGETSVSISPIMTTLYYNYILRLD